MVEASLLHCNAVSFCGSVLSVGADGLSEAVSAGGLFLLKVSFSSPLSPSVCLNGVIGLWSCWGLCYNIYTMKSLDVTAVVI